jgi:hypothetical protein
MNVSVPFALPLRDDRMYLTNSEGRRCMVVAAGDYVRFRSLRFAPTHIHRPYSRRWRVGDNVVERSRRSVSNIYSLFSII